MTALLSRHKPGIKWTGGPYKAMGSGALFQKFCREF